MFKAVLGSASEIFPKQDPRTLVSNLNTSAPSVHRHGLFLLNIPRPLFHEYLRLQVFPSYAQ